MIHVIHAREARLEILRSANHPQNGAIAAECGEPFEQHHPHHRASTHRESLARDSIDGARFDSWEVLRVGLLDVERTFRARSISLRTLADFALALEPPPVPSGGGLTLGPERRLQAS